MLGAEFVAVDSGTKSTFGSKNWGISNNNKHKEHRDHKELK
jgi:hypothetical protein